jgi:hypothetical protein
MTYRIVRFYADDSIPSETITTGLTLAQARNHCHDPETSSRTAKHPLAVERTKRYGDWFDGFEEEKGEQE